MNRTRRFEFKYMISYIDYLKVIDAIKLMFNHDCHGDKDYYNVTSIYLDDLVFSGASDKAFGNQFHKKYRIRYYNDASLKRLELKEKTGEVSVKYSTVINKEQFHGIIHQDLEILEKYFEDDLIRKFSLDMLKNYLTPTCFIQYNREAYMDDTNNLRITFDHDLCTERYSDEDIDIDYKLLKDTMLIMEVKYQDYLPRIVKDLLKIINPNQLAYSKYFMGYDSLEL